MVAYWWVGLHHVVAAFKQPRHKPLLSLFLFKQDTTWHIHQRRVIDIGPLDTDLQREDTVDIVLLNDTADIAVVAKTETEREGKHGRGNRLSSVN